MSPPVDSELRSRKQVDFKKTFGGNSHLDPSASMTPNSSVCIHMCTLLALLLYCTFNGPPSKIEE